MNVVLKIARRDIRRLVTVPAAWVIIIGLCVTPALYAWFNIAGFWDPYGNTRAIKVAIANEDAGASLGQLEALGSLGAGTGIGSSASTGTAGLGTGANAAAVKDSHSAAAGLTQSAVSAQSAAPASASTATGPASAAPASTAPTSAIPVSRLDLGSQIVTTLKGNRQLDWQFVSEAQALHQVKSGQSYAAIIIPKDFSADFLSIASGHFVRPQLLYYVNEKLNAIAPKVTDVGSTTIDDTVNSTFVSTVTDVIAANVKKAVGELGNRADSLQAHVTEGLRQSEQRLSTAQRALTDTADDINQSRSTVADAKKTLAAADDLLRQTSRLATANGNLLNQATPGLSSFPGSVFSALGQGSSLLAAAAQSANGSVGDFSGTVRVVQGKVSGVLSTAQTVEDFNTQTLAKVTGLVKDSLLDQASKDRVLALLDSIAAKNGQGAELLTSLVKTNQDVGSTVQALGQTSNDLSHLVQATTASGDHLRSELATTTVPALTGGIASLASASGQLSGGLAAQARSVAAAKGLLDQLDHVLDDSAKALSVAASTLGSLGTDLSGILTDTTALAGSATWSRILDLTGIDPGQVASFVASPTQLDQKAVYPVATYGSAMAPLFTNLSLWIGAFVLVVILKQEVDGEGLGEVTTTQAYLGRWLLFACFSVLQALIVCGGNLLLGVQTANAAAFVVTGVLVGLAYLSIVYALSKTLSHIGKALCVVLVMVQIPGGSGLYPIEMLPGFFRAVHPLLPFTYGIDAMRETIGGFYGTYYWQVLAALGVFVALAFLLGLLGRKRLTAFNRTFVEGLGATDFFVAETPEVARVAHSQARIRRARQVLAEAGGLR